MGKYASSADALESLAKLQPFQPDVARKLVVGGVAAVIGAGYLYFSNQNGSLSYDAALGSKEVATNLCLTASGAIFSLFGIKFIVDGLDSWVKPVNNLWVREDLTYLRSSGFVERTSPSDRIFGTRVRAAENMEDLHEIEDYRLLSPQNLRDFGFFRPYAFVNGFKSRYVYINPHRLITDKTLNIVGEFKGRDLTAVLKVSKDEVDKNVAAIQNQRFLYIIGRPRDNRIIVRSYGPALEDIVKEGK